MSASGGDNRETGREPTDESLVDASLAGDRKAFELLIARYQQSVFNIAYYKSKNCYDAEDLAQDVFLAAYRSLATLEHRANFSSWLFGIAYNRCHKWFHRERNKIVKIQELRQRIEREQRIAWQRRSGAPVAGSGDGEKATELAEFLERLPAETRAVLEMKYLEGLSYREIEARLGLESHRIDYLIRKGKKAIRELRDDAEAGS